MKTQPLPGTVRDAETQITLDAAYAAKSSDYVPRTSHKSEDRAKYVNRLILEPSPYLAQHAHNPVDWWPWGDAALAEAARRDCPIFLSAGYATCHWCHVMEEESFDNEQTATILNSGFLPIKLDREQSPDVDAYYMLATTLQHRHGGWPNSIWALPDGRPFHTGTYFPRPHFEQILATIAQGWKTDKRTDFERFSRDFSGSISKIQARCDPSADLTGAENRALAYLGQSYNAEFGGFSLQTQFPQEGNLLFLLDDWQRRGSADALEMATTTLKNIAAGGIHDHVGGGFHRYSVDVNWRTPHFEKMLYNQALLLRAFANAYAFTGEPQFNRAANRISNYVLRDLLAPDGTFYSAEDADSLDENGALVEGAFYVWTPEQATQALGTDNRNSDFGLYELATLEAGPVLHLNRDMGMPGPELDDALETLRQAREARARPLRDEKIILGWNALMIRALAESAMILEQPHWIESAEKALAACLNHFDGIEGLTRVHREGKSLEKANLADIAWTGLAAAALFDATGNNEHLNVAQRMADLAAEFEVDSGRYALSKAGLLGDIFEIEDGAVPSGESGALELFARLGDNKRASSLVDALSGAIAEMPITRLEALRAAQSLTNGSIGPIRRINGATVWRTRAGLHLRLDPDHHIDPGGLKTGDVTNTRAITGTTEQTTPTGYLNVTLTICTSNFCHAPETLFFRSLP